jgi:membrane protease YdiL (CAAX protease family)
MKATASRVAEVDSPASSDDRFAARLRGFGPLGILAILIILGGDFIIIPLSAILVLSWTKISRTPWREIGFVRPRSWPRTIAIGIIFGVALKFTMKAVVMPLLGAPPINWPFHYLAGNASALPMEIYTVTICAGFGEETFYRGWMFERMGKVLGRGLVAKVATILISGSIFAAAHYGVQGVPGLEQALIVGVLFGTIFAITGRLVVLMIAHAAFDLTALWMIYFDLETRIAHLIFN